MNFKGWLVSTMLSFGAVAGVSAQDVDEELNNKDTITVPNDAQQEVDLSKIKIDRVKIFLNGKPLDDRTQAQALQWLMPDTVLDDAQDAYKLNTDLQGNDRVLSRLWKNNSRAGGDSKGSISVKAYDGDKEVGHFNAEDAAQSETLEALPPETTPKKRTRNRGSSGTRNTRGTPGIELE